jgi:hypothetical protein
MELESYTTGLILRALIRMPGPASRPVRVNRNRELAQGLSAHLIPRSGSITAPDLDSLDCYPRW